MDVFDRSTVLASVITAIAILTVAFLTKNIRGPKKFDLPIVGSEDGDTNALKMRYVQEADVLLREGYQRVWHAPTEFAAMLMRIHSSKIKYFRSSHLMVRE